MTKCNRKIPNFFIVGASKAGTTSLVEALSMHPSIFMTHPKEPNFFSRYDDANGIEDYSLENYLKLYKSAESETVLGEASVRYLDSSQAAKHIYNFNPDSKALISLRNPMDRIRSLYEMYVRHGLEHSFDYVTRVDPWLVQQCLYYDRVKRYFDVFPRNQLLIIDFSDLIGDWISTISSVHKFLGLLPVQAEKPIIRNMGGLPRYSSLKVLQNRAVVGLGKKIVPRRYHTIVDKRVKALGFQRKELSQEEAAWLRPIFLDDVQRMDDLLNSQYSEKWIGRC